MKTILSILLASLLIGCASHYMANPMPCMSIRTCVGSIRDQVEANWYRPATDEKEGIEATVEVELTDKFEVASVSIRQSSGNSAFDNSVLIAVRSAGRFSQLGSLTSEDMASFRKFVLKFQPTGLGLPGKTH